MNTYRVVMNQARGRAQYLINVPETMSQKEVKAKLESLGNLVDSIEWQRVYDLSDFE